MENNTNSQRPSRAGNLNPMWGRHQSASAKQKQSEAAKRRAEQYKKALDSQHHITMDEFLGANPSVKEYLDILVKKQVKESIDKFLWNRQNQRISIPNI